MTWVQSLIQEDLTCWGGAKPMHHNYWACALETRSCNYWAHVPQLLKLMHPRAPAPQQEKAAQWEACTPQLESSPHFRQQEKKPIQQRRSSTTQMQNKIIKKNIKDKVTCIMGFPSGTNDKPLDGAGDIGDEGLIHGLGRSSGGGHSIPLQYSYLENPMDERSLEGYGTKSRKESDATGAA